MLHGKLQLRWLNMRRQNGFTLIEVLVIVSIITLLAAIILPVLNIAYDSLIEMKGIVQHRQQNITDLIQN